VILSPAKIVFDLDPAPAITWSISRKRQDNLWRRIVILTTEWLLDGKGRSVAYARGHDRRWKHVPVGERETAIQSGKSHDHLLRSRKQEDEVTRK
jgi:hypothetical protein